ncbi:MAG: DUF2442 domain-containing protein [Akkermansiaceae bacterium]|nr:DUF2442 domain-containing protein [Akkermansiaceae bacterium]
MLRVSAMIYMGGHRLHLEFNNGVTGEIDLSTELNGPIFRPLRDPAYFSSVRLEGGTIAWPNGADLAPEYLLERLAENGVAS